MARVAGAISEVPDDAPQTREAGDIDLTFDLYISPQQQQGAHATGSKTALAETSG